MAAPRWRQELRKTSSFTAVAPPADETAGPRTSLERDSRPARPPRRLGRRPSASAAAPRARLGNAQRRCSCRQVRTTAHQGLSLSRRTWASTRATTSASVAKDDRHRENPMSRVSRRSYTDVNVICNSCESAVSSLSALRRRRTIMKLWRGHSTNTSRGVRAIASADRPVRARHGVAGRPEWASPSESSRAGRAAARHRRRCGADQPVAHGRSGRTEHF